MASFSRSGSVSLAMAARSPLRISSTVEKGATLASSGLALTSARHALEDVHHLRVHRVLDPQRAVLVEGGDALSRRHEVRAPRRRGRLHKRRRSPAWPRRRSTTAAGRTAPARRMQAARPAPGPARIWKKREFQHGCAPVKRNIRAVEKHFRNCGSTALITQKNGRPFQAARCITAALDNERSKRLG